MSADPKLVAIADGIEEQFDVWWHNEGSAMRPLPNEDAEEHAKRVSKVAWLNGAYKGVEAAP